MRWNFFSLIIPFTLICVWPIVDPSSSAYGRVDYDAGFGPCHMDILDFDADDIEDIVVANTLGDSVSILIGYGDGTFRDAEDYQAGDGPRSLACGDFDNDGNHDLAVANGYDRSVSILLGNGDGSFQNHLPYLVGYGPWALVVEDFDADGCQDLAVSNYYDDTISILMGVGDGSFQGEDDYEVGEDEESLDGPRSVVVEDFDDDGNLDLAVSLSKADRIWILLGDGDGTFHEDPTPSFPTGEGPQSVAVGDFNDDSLPDLSTANNSDYSVSVLLGNGDGSFQAAEDFWVGDGPRSVTVLHYDDDGHQDMAVANYHGNRLAILRGDGLGSFKPPIEYITGQAPHSTAVRDFDDDDDEDIAVANYIDGTVSIFMNLRTCDHDQDGYEKEECVTEDDDDEIETDCDDEDPDTHPGANDPCYDELDQDCDGADGVDEIADNNIDDDCDGEVDESGSDDDSGCGCAVFDASDRPDLSQLMIAFLLYLLPGGYILVRRCCLTTE